MSPLRERMKFGVEWLASLAGVAAASPLLIAIGGAIALGSEGGALYRSNRIGKDGRLFTLLKFRTMRADARAIIDADDKTIVLDDDPRVTGIGKYLRSGLDELPQLINVLRGEMGLIGPRP